MASTGVGPAGAFLPRGIRPPRLLDQARDEPVGVQVLYGGVEHAPRLLHVLDLGVAPAAEAAVVVDGQAPLVAGSVGLGFGGPRRLTAARDFDDQGTHEVVVGLLDEASQKVGYVVV